MLSYQEEGVFSSLDSDAATGPQCGGETIRFATRDQGEGVDLRFRYRGNERYQNHWDRYQSRNSDGCVSVSGDQTVLPGNFVIAPVHRTLRTKNQTYVLYHPTLCKRQRVTPAETPHPTHRAHCDSPTHARVSVAALEGSPAGSPRAVVRVT